MACPSTAGCGRCEIGAASSSDEKDEKSVAKARHATISVEEFRWAAHQPRLVSVEEYLSTSYQPEWEYLDAGTLTHSAPMPRKEASSIPRWDISAPTAGEMSASSSRSRDSFRRVCACRSSGPK